MSGGRLGPYHLIRELTRGPASVLHLARSSDGQTVVVKELITDAASEIPVDEQLARFQRECQIHLRLKHPNIVEAIDQGEDQGRAFLVMAHHPGTNLEDMIKVSSPDLIESLELMRPLCRAVQHLHDQGVIHRDIKPSNVLITHDNRVLLTDFGCARLVFTPRLTQNRMILGTLAYMSPEQLLGSEEADGRSDLFSLGIILYQLLTGRLPFAGEGATEIVQKLLYGDPQALSNPRIPGSLERIVTLTLQKDPDYRVPSAKGLEGMLARVLAEPEIYVAQGETCEARGDTKRAESLYRAALQYAPAFMPAATALSRLHLQARRWEEAKGCLYHLMMQDSPPAEVFFQLGLVHQELGEAPEALKMFQRAWTLRPDERDYEFQVALTLQNLRREGEAADHYLSLASRHPDWAAPHFQLGRIRYAKGQHKQAQAHFETASQCDPTSAETWYNLGCLHNELGRLEEAKQAWQTALRLNPDLVEIHHNLGCLLYQMGQAQEALPHLEHANRLRPSWARTHLTRGLVLEALGRDEAALEAFQEAVRVEPDDHSFPLYLAAAFRRRYRLESAIGVLERTARTVGARKAQVWYQLALAYRERGYYKEALMALKTALQAPDHRDIPEAVQVLAKWQAELKQHGPRSMAI